MKQPKTNLKEKAVDLAYAALDVSISAKRNKSKELMRLSVQTKEVADTLRRLVEGHAYKQEVLIALWKWQDAFEELTESELTMLKGETQSDRESYQIYEEQKGRKACRKQDVPIYIEEVWVHLDPSIKKKKKK